MFFGCCWPSYLGHGDHYNDKILISIKVVVLHVIIVQVILFYIM